MAESITQMLLRWSDGDQAALDQLLPLVYDELRRLAHSFLRRQPFHHTLQPTALVHEAYLRMVDQQRVSWESRAQFFGLAATLMRRILPDSGGSHPPADGGEARRRRDQSVAVGS